MHSCSHRVAAFATMRNMHYDFETNRINYWILISNFSIQLSLWANKKYWFLPLYRFHFQLLWTWKCCAYSSDIQQCTNCILKSLFKFNSSESGMNQRCTDPPVLLHDIMRSVKMEERKWSGLQDYSVACRSLASTIGYVVSYASCASLVTCGRQNWILTKDNL